MSCGTVSCLTAAYACQKLESTNTDNLCNCACLAPIGMPASLLLGEGSISAGQPEVFVEEEGVLCAASPLLNLGKGGSDFSFKKAQVGIVPVV